MREYFKDEKRYRTVVASDEPSSLLLMQSERDGSREGWILSMDRNQALWLKNQLENYLGVDPGPQKNRHCDADIPGNPDESYSDTVHETRDTCPFLSVQMMAQKAVDHLTLGECGPSTIKHKVLDDWITKAKAYEQALTESGREDVFKG